MGLQRVCTTEQLSLSLSLFKVIILKQTLDTSFKFSSLNSYQERVRKRSGLESEYIAAHTYEMLPLDEVARKHRRTI